MADIEDIVALMVRSPANLRFEDLCKVCDHYFGPPRQMSGSHRIYKTPWRGDPRVNIQSAGGRAKAYQVRQVLKAIQRMEHENGPGE